MSDFEIDIHVEDLRWTEFVDLLDSLVSRAIRASLAYLNAHELAHCDFSEVSLAFVSDDKIQKLNAEYRGKDKPTNVLSFPGTEIDGFKPLLGDIVLAYETAVAEALDRSIERDDHIVHLVVHGFLHLMGYDHENNQDADIMESIEIKILEGLGIASPYDKGELL
ncbi:MAG: rRNA maturation RNase YbeY [Acidimicrobiales bacterium]|nr:rRNA maturation RNase YbeY [Hyphomonadaceae bacterium]RZV45083.1 MAG: rRNA maturation RNase YbeY [Acidimicrobiales bacterium]